MFTTQRAAALASRGLSRRTLPICRLYSSEGATPTPSPTSTPPTPTPAPTSASDEKPKAATPPKPKPKPAPSSFASSPSHSNVVYTPRPLGYEPPSSSSQDEISTEIPTINWAQTYHGISVKPVSERQFKMLMEPLDEKDIEVKPDGVVYLPEIKYRRKLNETFGPMGWGIIPKGEAVVGDAIVTREYALIVDGRFVSQAQGENSYFSPEQLPSAVEGCKSNALMRCCKDLGIGSELWDPHFIRWFRKNHMEEVWVEHVTTKKKRTFWYRKGMVDVAYPYKVSK